MSEVIVCASASQFEIEPGTGVIESEFACGEFAGAGLKYAVQPGQKLTATPEDVDATADAYYTKYIGPNIGSDVNGTIVDVMHMIIVDDTTVPTVQNKKLKYQDITSISPTSTQANDIAAIKASFASGRPIVATVDETSVYDLDLGRNPYSWGPSGTHIVLYVGISSDGNLLVHDSANIVGPLMVNNTIMTQPRRYDINKIATHWATMVTMPWANVAPQGANNVIPVLTWNKTLPAGSAIEQQAKDIWGDPLTWDSGIADGWKRMYAQGYKAGSPIKAEVATVDEMGNAIVEREFAMGVRIEYTIATSTPRFFTLTQEIKFK